MDMGFPYANLANQWMLRTSLDKELSAMEKLGAQGRVGEGLWMTGGAAAAPPPAAAASFGSSGGSSPVAPPDIRLPAIPVQLPPALGLTPYSGGQVPDAPTLVDPLYAAKFGVNLADRRFTTGMTRSPFGSGGSFNQRGRFYGQSYWGSR